MADAIPLNASDARVSRLYDRIDRLIETELRAGNVTTAAAIGIVEMIKLSLYAHRAGLIAANTE